MCDRTTEFRRLSDQLGSSSSLKANSNSNSSSSHRGEAGSNVPNSKSQFIEATSDIAKGIHRTSQVLGKLTKLVRSQGLFDDPTDEINSLVHRIKQDISELNSKCDSAQQYVDSRKRSLGDVNQLTTHSVNVVSQLKSGLMNATKDFKNVLELRSVKMKDQQERKAKLTGSSILSPTKQFSNNGNGNEGKNGNRQPRTSSIATPYSQMENHTNGYRDDESNGHHNGALTTERQLLLAPPVDAQYYESREKAVTEVEKTIRELGQLFQRLGTMISQQQEMIERIDEDIESSIAQTEQATNVLQKAYENVSSNSGLYTKIFFILAIFALFFLLFLM